MVRHIENKEQNVRFKSGPIDKSIKNEWVKQLIKDRDCQTGLKKIRSNYTLSTEIFFRLKGTDKLKVKGWKISYHAETNHEKAGVVLIISNKIDFKTKSKA